MPFEASPMDTGTPATLMGPYGTLEKEFTKANPEELGRKPGTRTCASEFPVLKERIRKAADVRVVFEYARMLSSD
jgi:hypothetical protein